MCYTIRMLFVIIQFINICEIDNVATLPRKLVISSHLRPSVHQGRRIANVTVSLCNVLGNLTTRHYCTERTLRVTQGSGGLCLHTIHSSVAWAPPYVRPPTTMLVGVTPESMGIKVVVTLDQAMLQSLSGPSRTRWLMSKISVVMAISWTPLGYWDITAAATRWQHTLCRAAPKAPDGVHVT